MIKIPQFTFFCGPNTKQKRELATLFAEKIMPPPLNNQMYNSIEEAATALFFNDPLIPDEALEKEPPGLKGPTIRAFVGLIAHTIRSEYGAEALGKLALEQYRSGGWEEVFAHTIYTDVDDRRDTIPFLRQYGAENCLCVETGPLTTIPVEWTRRVKLIWLPTPTVESQLAQLIRDLAPTRTIHADEASNGTNTTRDSANDSSGTETEAETPPTH